MRGRVSIGAASVTIGLPSPGPGPVGAAIGAAVRTLPALATALSVPVPHGPRHGEDGWQLVAYDREWLQDVALLTYEHPRRGTVEVMRGLCSGRVVL